MTNKFLSKMVEKLKDDDLSIMHSGQAAAEFTTFMDTGSYVLNALFGADIFGGIADNKAIAFAGESSAGKSFFVMGIMKNFLIENPEAIIIYYDTESAITKSQMSDRGIDTTRVLLGEPATIEQFRLKALNFLVEYSATPEKERPKCMMVLDSLGMLSTTKEVNDTAEGKDTKDMTRAGIIRATFRTLRLKLAKAKVPIFITNHTYACLIEGTLIKSNGLNIPIEALKIGDLVDTVLGPKEIEETFTYVVPETIKLTLSDGTIIEATPTHKFLTETLKWKTVDELVEGDSVVLF